MVNTEYLTESFQEPCKVDINPLLQMKNLNMKED